MSIQAQTVIGGVAALGSLSSFAVAVAAFIVSRRAANINRSNYVTDLRREWESLQESWVRSLLLVRGPDDYYVAASSEVREQVRSLLDWVESPKGKSDRNIMQWVNRSRSETHHIRRVVRFMAHAADLILTGKMEVQDVYAVVGPDVSRHQAALRTLCGADSSMTGANWERFVWQALEHSYCGERDRVMTLIDLLWSEVADRGDNHSHSIMGIAVHKRETGSGRACRARISRLTGNRIMTARRLRRNLLRAERPPFHAICRDDALVDGDSLTAGYITYGRGPYWLRQLRARRHVQRWMRSYLAGETGFLADSRRLNRLQGQ